MTKLPEVLPVNKYMPLLVTTKPTRFNGKWLSPAVSRLQLVKLRDAALKEGLVKEEFPVQEKDRVPMKSHTRPPKGHKRDVKKLEKSVMLFHLLFEIRFKGDFMCGG